MAKRAVAEVEVGEIPFVDLKAQYRLHRDVLLHAVEAVLEGANFIMGPDLQAFEQEFADYLGLQYCVGVGSGTAALRLGLEALGIGKGDEVIIPANTYIASAFAISQLGATPVLVDVDEQHLIDTDLIEAAMTSRTKAIMPVHLYGQAVDLDPLMRTARNYGVRVIEDACQAHGARYRGQRLGAFGDVAAFSFYPGKNLGAYGDGGAVVTADAEIADRVRLLRDFGQRRKYEHLIIADNCRLDTIQAAVLRVKLRYLDGWNERRRAAARSYDERLSALDVSPAPCRDVGGHAYHLYVIRVPRRDAAIEALARDGIQTGAHYPVPIHLQPAYAFRRIKAGRYPRAEKAAGEVLSLPMFPEIQEGQIERVVASLGRHIGNGRGAD
ncbi:MAG: DegT/DnrJ/EryC1/StrS family aminotransferase [Candidatus Tyrphobacter sp.]